MMDNPGPARLTFAVLCAGLGGLLGLLFVSMERVEPHVDTWLRETFVPWLARKNIMNLEFKPLDVKAVVLVLDFFLGTYAVILALLSVRIVEGSRGQRMSRRVQGLSVLLVAVGVAPVLYSVLGLPLYLTVGPRGLALAIPFKVVLLHLGIVGVYFAATRRLSLLQAALLGVLVVGLTTFKVLELDRRVDVLVNEILKLSGS